MNINATLFGQMITFGIFIWFTMKYVWPPVTQALHDRQQKIAEGLAAAERGEHELELAQKKASEQLRSVKQEANEIIEKANKRAVQIVEDSKLKAREEGKRQLELAKEEITSEIQKAKQVLRKQIAGIAIAGAEKIIQRNLDEAANSDIIDSVIKDI